MDEKAMDEEMMEAPAPSVALSGSAKMGIKNVSSDNTAMDTGMALVEEFQVGFASSGTTDGGLMFGASLAIEQDGRDSGKVKGSTVYIGGAWKLAFGDPDPGAWSAGGIGVSEEDNILLASGQKISLSGSIEGASYVLTSNAPTADGVDNQWSMGVKYAAGAVNVGVGMDSEKGLALGINTDLSGVSTSVFYAQSESKDNNDLYISADPGDRSSPIPDGDLYGEKRTGLGVKASMAAGEGATISLAYSTKKVEQTANAGVTVDAASELVPSEKTKKIQVYFDYGLGGGATFNAGIDQVDVEGGAKTTTIEASIAMSF